MSTKAAQKRKDLVGYHLTRACAFSKQRRGRQHRQKAQTVGGNTDRSTRQTDASLIGSSQVRDTTKQINSQRRGLEREVNALKRDEQKLITQV